MPIKSITKAEMDVKKSRMIVALSEMPPLQHWPDRTKPFNFMESDVCAWLMEQPDLWAWAFQKAKDLGVIRFSEGKWSGISFEKKQ